MIHNDERIHGSILAQAYLITAAWLVLALTGCVYANSRQDVAHLLITDDSVPEGWEENWRLSARASRSVADDLPAGVLDFAAISLEQDESMTSTPASIGQVVWLFRTEDLAQEQYHEDQLRNDDLIPGHEIGLDYDSKLADELILSCEQLQEGLFSCTASARYGSINIAIHAPVGPEMGLTSSQFLSMLQHVESKLEEMNSE